MSLSDLSSALSMRPKPAHAAPHIAVVEDDPGLLTDLVEFLELRGFAAQGFAHAEAFLAVWPATPFDLLLLDVALPGASGLDVAQRVRARGADDTPGIIMLSALDANDDQVSGFNAGADVYLSKRSSLEVIEAACQGVLRRLDARRMPLPAPAADTAWRLHAKDWRLDAPNGTRLDLTNAEVLLLSALFETPGSTVTREALLVSMKKQPTLFSLRNLDNTASRLRRKVQSACGIGLPLRSSYGQGYTFAATCTLER
jgi:DNA-binding response OmpR family regulator